MHDPAPKPSPGSPSAGAMRAAVYRRYGPPEEVVRVERVPPPVLAGPRDVLVRVHAAAVARGDWRLLVADPFVVRLYQGLLRIKRPVLGYGLSGVVAAVGPAVTRFRPGDAVFGESPRAGGFAELARLAEDELALLSDGVPHAVAAATPFGGTTALQGLRDHGRLRAGARVLVIGAGGVVGTAAVQLAVHLGARVTGVDGAAKLDHVRAMGAHAARDRRAFDLAATAERFDVVLDTVGAAPIAACRRVLAPDGRYVAVSGPLSRTARLSLFGGPRMAGMIAKANPVDLETLRGLLAAGALRPPVARRYPLEETAAALRAVGDGGLCGAVVVTP